MTCKGERPRLPVTMQIGPVLPSTPRPAQPCFPANAKIEVQGLGQLPMSQLEVGHKVLTMDASGRQAYDEVGWTGRVGSCCWTGPCI